MKHCTMTTALLLLLVALYASSCGQKADSAETKPADTNRTNPPPKAPPPKINPTKFEHEYLTRGHRQLLVFDGTVEKISELPTVEEMNYDDLISTLKVHVDNVIHGSTDAASLVMQVPVVRKKTPLPGARIAKGDKVRFSAVPWNKVVESIKSIEQVDNVMDYNSPVYFAMALTTPDGHSPSATKLAGARTEAIEQAKGVIKRELKAFGNGDWGKWRASMAPLYNEISDRADELPENKFGKKGLIVEPTLPVEIVGTPSDENPGVEQIIRFERELRSRGIDFIYVSIPRPWMIYPEDITDIAPPHDYATPNYRQNLLSLMEADVEVVDTLPLLLANKKSSKTKFYTPHSADLHPPMEAMGIVAEAVAERLRRYGYSDLQYEFLTTRPAPGIEELNQVIAADGNRYEDNPDSPLLFIGDSTIRINHPAPSVGFTGQLAQLLGFRPSLLQRNSFKLADFAKENPTILQGKRVVVWVAWSLCLGKINAHICWNPIVDWSKSRVFSTPK